MNKQIIVTIALLIVLLFLLNCSSSLSTLKYDCTYSKNEIVETKEDAIAIAILFLDKKGQEDYYKDSVFVDTDEDGNFNVSFKIKEQVLPGITMLSVRKKDGCVALFMLE
jgi:hypothetical protein